MCSVRYVCVCAPLLIQTFKHIQGPRTPLLHLRRTLAHMLLPVWLPNRVKAVQHTCRGVAPLSFTASISAPASSRAVRHSARPISAAAWSGVQPVERLTETLAPRESKRRWE